jgi:hypothetical protein
MKDKTKLILVAVVILTMISSLLLPLSIGYIQKGDYNQCNMSITIPTVNAFDLQDLTNFVTSNVPVPGHVEHTFTKTYSDGDIFAIVKTINNTAYCFAWVKNSGTVTLYKSDGSSWGSPIKTINGIVPGTEKTMILTYPVNQSNNDVATSNLSVILTAPNNSTTNFTGTINNVYDFTLTVSGGIKPYHIQWSVSGYQSFDSISDTVFKGHYKWDTPGTYTVYAVVTDADSISQQSNKIQVIIHSPFTIYVTPAALIYSNNLSDANQYPYEAYGIRIASYTVTSPITQNDINLSYLSYVIFQDPSGNGGATVNITKVLWGGKDITNRCNLTVYNGTPTSASDSSFTLQGQTNNNGIMTGVIHIIDGEVLQNRSDYGGIDAVKDSDLPIGPDIPITIECTVSDQSGKTYTATENISHVYYSAPFYLSASSVTHSYMCYTVPKYVYYVTYIDLTYDQNGNPVGHLRVKKVETSHYYGTYDDFKNSADFKNTQQELEQGIYDNQFDYDPVNNTVQPFTNAVSQALHYTGGNGIMHPWSRDWHDTFTGVVIDNNGTTYDVDGSNVTVHHTVAQDGQQCTSAVSGGSPYAHSSTYDLSKTDDTDIAWKYENYSQYIIPDTVTFNEIKPNPIPAEFQNDSLVTQHCLTDKDWVIFNGGEFQYAVQPSYGSNSLTGIISPVKPVWDFQNGIWDFNVNLDNTSITTANNLPYKIKFVFDYTNLSSKIITVQSYYDSITINDSSDTDSTYGLHYASDLIVYIASDGTMLSPKTQSNDIVKAVTDSSSGKLIAVAYENNGHVMVYGLASGQGTLSYSADELGGPFGINIPVQVQLSTDNSIAFSVNNNPINIDQARNSNPWYWIGSDYSGFNNQAFIDSGAPYIIIPEANNIKQLQGYHWTYAYDNSCRNYLDYNDYSLYDFSPSAVYHTNVTNTGKVPLHIVVSYQHPYGNGYSYTDAGYTVDIDPGQTVNIMQQAIQDGETYSPVHYINSNGEYVFYTDPGWTLDAQVNIYAIINGQNFPVVSGHIDIDFPDTR